MPNWCNNNATITFKNSKAADEFTIACHSDRPKPVPGTLLDMTEPSNLFEHYLPMPKDIGDKWYDWCTSNWGTKWPPNIGDVMRIGDNMVSIAFETAWGPPLEWFQTCGPLHDWEWQLEYIELGMGFAGMAEGDKHGSNNDHFGQDDEAYTEIAEHFGIDLVEYDDDDPQPPP